jgi:hypothetical protein
VCAEGLAFVATGVVTPEVGATAEIEPEARFAAA